MTANSLTNVLTRSIRSHVSNDTRFIHGFTRSRARARARDDCVAPASSQELGWIERIAFRSRRAVWFRGACGPTFPFRVARTRSKSRRNREGEEAPSKAGEPLNGAALRGAARSGSRDCRSSARLDHLERCYFCAFRRDNRLGGAWVFKRFPRSTEESVYDRDAVRNLRLNL